MNSKAATFAAMDQLPAALRHEIAFSARVWDACIVLPHYRNASQQRGRDWAIDWLRASMRAADDDDVRDFGTKYLVSYGLPWPHIAAGATILRYQPPRGVPVQRLRRSAEPRIRAAFLASERLMPR